jgi:short-subunit dehydrogenase
MSPWALITGASTGIGRELAKLLAADKFNLILVARNQAQLEELAAQLRAREGVEIKIIARDLAAPGVPLEIFESLRQTPVSILVNNAGVGHYGAFAQIELSRALEIMHLNLDALVQLTHLFLQPMRLRGAGKVLNVASTAAFQPGPMVSIYYASKAFVYSFSYALAEEMKDTGITITTLCPGPTNTQFFARGNFAPVKAALTMEPTAVAAAGLRGLMRGQRVVIPGVVNRLGAFFGKHLPASWTTAFVRRLHKGSSPTPDH